MMNETSKAKSLRRGLTALGVLTAISTLGAASAFAGSCPADKVVADGAGQKAGATMPKDVSDVVLTSVDLGKEKTALPEHFLRLRRLEIKSGGQVPWHSHGDRPAIIYIIKGEVTEYASTCAVPIVHKAGEATPETSATSHWWMNTGKETAVLVSADVQHDPNDHNM